MNVLLFAAVFAAFVVGAIGVVSLTATIFQGYGIDILPDTGFLEFLVAQYDIFKTAFIVPELKNFLAWLRVAYAPWMADAMTVYYYVSFGLTLLLLAPIGVLGDKGSVLGATAALIRGVPGAIRLPIVMAFLTSGPVFALTIPFAFLTIVIVDRIVASIVLMIVALVLGIVLTPVIAVTVAIMLLVALVWQFATVAVVALVCGVSYVLARGIRMAAEGIEEGFESRGISPFAFAFGIVALIPMALAMGAGFVALLVACDALWVFGIAQYLL